jgi:hypothetical protein
MNYYTDHQSFVYVSSEKKSKTSLIANASSSTGDFLYLYSGFIYASVLSDLDHYGIRYGTVDSQLFS